MTGVPELDPELIGAIQRVCFDAMRGSDPGPGLAQRLERDCTALLNQRGFAQAQVRAESTALRTVVNILLPREGKPVQQIRLRVK